MDEFQKQIIKNMFEDHPVLYDYLLLNAEENISTVDELIQYSQSGRYRPQENPSDLHLMITMMLVLNTQ